MTNNSSSYRWWVMLVVIIGGFMSILDTSIVNIAMPKMMAVFGVGTDKAQWILTVYMLTMGVLQPTTGYLCDVWGAKRMYIASMVIFTIGSALCGLAWSNDSMIGFRIIQAVGGGVIIPVGMSIIYTIFPPEERNLAMGVWGISAMVAPAIGPTLSGYFVEYLDWRLIFTINVPVGIVGTILAAFILRESPVRKQAKFDMVGFLTSALGLFCLLLALSEVSDEGWTSIYILSLLFVSFVSLLFFVIYELMHEDPLLDLTLFKNPTFSASTLVTFIGTVCLYGGIFLVPLFMENLRNYSAMQNGILLFPAAAMAGIMMPISGKIADRVGARPVVIVGLILLGLGNYGLRFLDLDTSYNYILWFLIIRSIGLGLFMMPVTVAGMNTVPFHKIARASAMNNAVRQVSGSFGIAILTTILQNRQVYHLNHMADYINAASLGTQQIAGSLQNMFALHGSTVLTAKTQALAVVSQLVQRQAYIFSFDDTFLVTALTCFLALIPALMLKEKKRQPDAAPLHIAE
ncbi:MAG TPA: MFS transporter [Firmicutes bacterium]|nr:MFS transporter [Bacillota bacterium]